MPQTPTAHSQSQRRRWLQSTLTIGITTMLPLAWKFQQRAVVPVSTHGGRIWRPFDALMAADRARTPRPSEYPRSIQAWQSEFFR